MLYYKENFEEVIERRTRIQNPDYCGAIVQVTGIREMADRVKPIPCKPLNKWNFDTELYDFLDIKLQNARMNWAARTEVMDDSIPAISPCFGIAEHSTFMGGTADFEEETSYQVPFVEMEEDCIDSLHFHREDKLLNYILKSLEYLKDKAGTDLGVHLRGAEDPGDVANAIRGSEFFMDFYDEPELMAKLLEKCCEGNMEYMKLQKNIVGDFYGGTLTGMSGFLPANSFGHLALDWTYMCSADFFRDFDKELLIRQIADYDSALMHVHGGGAHIIPDVASIDKIGTMQISLDPNQPRVIEVFKQYEDSLKRKLIIGGLSYQELKDNVDFLKDKRMQIQIGAATFAEAKEIIHFVRENLPIVKRK